MNAFSLNAVIIAHQYFGSSILFCHVYGFICSEVVTEAEIEDCVGKTQGG